MNSLKGMATFCVVAFVTGCAGSSAPAIPLRSLAPSWSGAALAKDDLIYVTNGNEEVTVYSLETQKLVGVLTHFTKPMGECVDASGNIYITDAGTHTVVEYAHGGSKAIETFDDSPDTPYTCAVDPTTGNLASRFGRKAGAVSRRTIPIPHSEVSTDARTIPQEIYLPQTGLTYPRSHGFLMVDRNSSRLRCPARRPARNGITLRESNGTGGISCLTLSRRPIE
jgi:hypothetical protein